MDTYGPLFSDAEDLCRGVIDAALARDDVAGKERQRACRHSE